MYKALTIVLIAIIGIASAANVQASSIKRAPSAMTKPSVGLDLCPTCLNVADESINILLNLILDTGIIGSCQTLCTALAQKTSEIVGVICEIVCDGFGIDEFIKALENADIDPIYYCELAKFCPGNNEIQLVFLKVNHIFSFL